jgi:hypothetical protein
MRRQPIRLIRKRPRTLWPSFTFGARPYEYYRWAPHACGICAVMMVAYGFGRPATSSIYALIRRAVDLGVFVLQPDGKIGGAFHGPLLKLAGELGLTGSVEPDLSRLRLVDAIDAGGMAVLSVGLERWRSDLSGAHLVVIERRDSTRRGWIIHDCADAIDDPGQSVRLSEAELEAISNAKGLVLYADADWRPSYLSPFTP